MGGIMDNLTGLISIHAPRAGSDDKRQQYPDRDRQISIHAPRAGSDIINDGADALDNIFQSTLPVRGAT